jgi:hypothetical protein
LLGEIGESNVGSNRSLISIQMKTDFFSNYELEKEVIDK